MLNPEWIEAFSDAAQTVWTVLRDLWVKDLWPLLMTLGIFLALAAPIIIVILILWYLDSIGWRAGDGFYTIGTAGAQVLLRRG